MKTLTFTVRFDESKLPPIGELRELKNSDPIAYKAAIRKAVKIIR